MLEEHIRPRGGGGGREVSVPKFRRARTRGRHRGEPKVTGTQHASEVLAPRHRLRRWRVGAVAAHSSGLESGASGIFQPAQTSILIALATPGDSTLAPNRRIQNRTLLLSGSDTRPSPKSP